MRHVEEVEKANETPPDDPDAPPSPPGKASAKSSTPRRRKLSRTDPDARMATNKYNQRLEPCLKQLTGIDSRCGVNVDIAVVRADTHEGATLHSQINRDEALTGIRVETVTADTAYGAKLERNCQ